MTTTTLRLIFAAAIGSLLVALVYASIPSRAFAAGQTFQPFKTVWIGVYTREQAARGKLAAAQTCNRCHGVDLKGGTAPALTRSAFFDRWHDLKLLDTIVYIQSAMPHGHDFFVSSDSARDIVAFMLQESGVPSGNEPTPKDADALANILITRPAKR
jgi:quinoprotein glucose dehydrogenase